MQRCWPYILLERGRMRQTISYVFRSHALLTVRRTVTDQLLRTHITPCSAYVTSRTFSLSRKKWRERAIGFKSRSSPSSSENPGGSGRSATLSQATVCHLDQPARRPKTCFERTKGFFLDQLDSISGSYSQQKTVLCHAVNWTRQHDAIGGRHPIGKGRVALHSKHSSSCPNIVLGGTYNY